MNGQIQYNGVEWIHPYGNQTDPSCRLHCSWFFLIIYVISVVGNLGMIILTKPDFRLQTPCTFFPGHLAFTELGCSTAIGPQMLGNFVLDQYTVSYYSCAIQLAFFLVFIISEHFILSAMSYDHHVVHVTPCSTQLSCHQGYVGCWTIPYLYCAFVFPVITVKTFSLPFCGYNVIRHFYCDSFPLLSLLCSNTHEVGIIIQIIAGFDLISSLLIVLISYLLILPSTLRISSSEGRHKAFSTCESHLVVVTVFHGALIFMYMQPESNNSFDTDKMASMVYTLVQFSRSVVSDSLRPHELQHARLLSITSDMQITPPLWQKVKRN